MAGVTISRGQLAKVIAKVSRALDGHVPELLQDLARRVASERGRDGPQGQRRARWWTWCFRRRVYTVFHLDRSRGSGVLLEVLGQEFEGVLGCDYFSAYRKYMRECGMLVQFCLAHLIRDVKFLLTVPDGAKQAYGQRLREALRGLFAVIHRQECLSPAAFARALSAARQRGAGGGDRGRPGQRSGPATWPSASGSMGRRISSSSRPRASSRPTTWPSRPSASW